MHRIVNHVLGERLDGELRAVAPESSPTPAVTVDGFEPGRNDRSRLGHLGTDRRGILLV